MTGGGTEVSGGPGGLAADLAAMHSAAAVLATAAADLADLAVRVAALTMDADLARTGSVDPVGFARVQSALLPLVAGPRGLAGCSLRLGALAVGAAAAADLYAASERGAAAAMQRLRDGVGRLAGAGTRVALTTGLPMTTLGVMAASVTWAGHRSVPLVLHEAALVAADAAAGRFDLGSLDDRYVRLTTRQLVALRQDAGAGAGEAVAWLAQHPEVAEQLAQGLPAYLDGVTGPLVLPGSPRPGEHGDGRAWPPEDPSEVAAVLSALAAVSPLFVQGRVEVRRVQGTPPAVPGTGAGGVLGAVQRLVPYSPPLPEHGVTPRTPFAQAGPVPPYEPARIGVERIERAGRTSWSVYVPPTQSWRLDGGSNPFDGSTNVRSVGGRTTAAGVAVSAALRAAGAAQDEPVMLSGYSQGGLTAVQLACDPQFRDEFMVTTVLSVGSPVAGFEVPPDVEVLSIEHEQDLAVVPDDGRNPDRPNWTTVRRDLAHPSAAGPQLFDDLRRDPFTAHRIQYYLDTAQVVDASEHDSVAGWQRAAAPFLDTGDARVEVTEWQARRIRDD